jgi:hypothetical protein
MIIGCSPDPADGDDPELPSLLTRSCSQTTTTTMVSTVDSASTNTTGTDDEEEEEDETLVDSKKNNATTTGAAVQDTTNASTTRPAAMRRRSAPVVSFGQLHIREFPVVLGDNPSVQWGGPPIRLGYEEVVDTTTSAGTTTRTTTTTTSDTSTAAAPAEPVQKVNHNNYILSIDDYEEQRAPRRRPVTQLRVPANVRREWVGYDPVLERQVAYEQRQRNHSVAMADYDEWHYFLECAMRGITKRVRRLSGGNKTKSSSETPTAANEITAEQWVMFHKKAQQRLQEYQKLQEQQRMQERRASRQQQQPQPK